MNTSVAEAAGLTGALVVLGGVLKQVPAFPDKWIPTTLIGVGLLTYLGLNGFTWLNAVVGIQTAASATGLNQLWRQHTSNDTQTQVAPTIPKP